MYANILVMHTFDRSSEQPPCWAPGCLEPRKRYPSGRINPLCSAHELARVNGIRSRLVLDPVTGQAIAASVLATRTQRRRAAAAPR